MAEETKPESTEKLDEKAPESSEKAKAPDVPSIVDKLWNDWSQADKREILALANEAQEARLKTQEEPQKPKPAETKPKPESEDPIDRLIDRVAGLEKSTQERNARDEAQIKVVEEAKVAAAFNARLDEQLDQHEIFGGDKQLCEELKEEYTGSWMKHRWRDIDGSFKKFLERQVERANAVAKGEKVRYVKGKIATAQETAGETSGGITPARKAWAPTADEFNDGTMDDKVKELLAK